MSSRNASEFSIHREILLCGCMQNTVVTRAISSLPDNYFFSEKIFLDSS
jgi:hypothetical protein